MRHASSTTGIAKEHVELGRIYRYGTADVGETLMDILLDRATATSKADCRHVTAIARQLPGRAISDTAMHITLR